MKKWLCRRGRERYSSVRQGRERYIMAEGGEDVSGTGWRIGKDRVKIKKAR